MSGTATIQPAPSLDNLQSDGPVSLFLDFDGTLVGIAPTPDSIVVAEGMAEALAQLAKRLEGRLALISGRAISDIEGHVGPLGIPRAGSHGADMRLADGAQLADAPAAFPVDAKEELAEFSHRAGFSLEDKPHGAALHYRANPELEDEGLAFAAKVAETYGLDIKRGKCVIELVHPGADKGAAVRAFMGHPLFAGTRPYFIGDDVTDEDGFAAVAEFGGAGILVGYREPSLAQFRLEDPAAVHAWLGLGA